MKKAALINYFNDYDMLELLIESGQLDWYDKIYLWDGPYSYATSFEPANLHQRPFSETDIGKTFINDVRVVYNYKIWADEAEKRISAYSAVQEDIVFLHDTDEFLKIHEEDVEKFILSGNSVGYFNCQNLYLNGAYVTTKFYNTRSWSALPHKCFAFKKQHISAIEHLDYLWLVGVNQGKPDNNKKFGTSLASGYHFTGMRSAAGQLQKHVFYISLHEHTSGKNYFRNKLLQALSDGLVDESQALGAYLRSSPTFYGVHGGLVNGDDNIVCANRIVESDLEKTFNVVLSTVNKPGDLSGVLIDGLSCFLYYGSDVKAIELILGGNVIVTVYDLPCGESAKKRGEPIKVSDKMVIEQNPGVGSFGFVVKIVQHGADLVAFSTIQHC